MNRRIGRGISCGVPVFPPGPPVTVVVDGRRVPQYARAFVADGRVYATASLVGSLADKVWVSGRTLSFERDGRVVRVALASARRLNPDSTYVAIAPVLRGLGDRVRFRSGVLEVRTAAATPVATPTPFAPGTAGAPQRAVFTPEPVPTPRPVWTGSPLPRRTPLPFPPAEARLRPSFPAGAS